jgi:hypothetical protein
MQVVLPSTRHLHEVERVLCGKLSGQLKMLVTVTEACITEITAEEWSI